MTAIPLGMLVVFIVWMAGGPRQSVRWVEGVLGSTLTWVREIVR
jgi:hypothetical protein